jgi:hypothetical protein
MVHNEGTTAERPEPPNQALYGAWATSRSAVHTQEADSRPHKEADSMGSEGIDHSECVPAGQHSTRAHTHEGQPGKWLFPDEAGKGLYDDSPAGA